MILVTGGLGYIGSHATVKLIEAGFKVIVLDNLCNSHLEVINRIKVITGCDFEFVYGDVRDRLCLNNIFSIYKIDAVIHFAGLKAVGESTLYPLKYYDNNLNGGLVLFEEMRLAGVKRLVFSSSATVYGDPECVPISESSRLNPTNPYGRSKLFLEKVLRDLFLADAGWQIASLRYFNPVGAHISGLIGEDPAGTPNNLMPIISQVAIGKIESLKIYGDDYLTHDGTGVRDYVHVDDLALGHIAALKSLGPKPIFLTVNLGSGKGYSVFDMIQAFEKASGKSVPYEVVGRRPGDIATCYADVALASKLLQWRAKLGIQQMCEDSWRWQSKNPNGYQ